MEDTGGLARSFWGDLEEKAQLARERRRLDPAIRDALILDLCSTVPLSVRELSQLLDRTDAYTGDAVRPLVEGGRLTYLYPEQPRHPKQRYLVPDSPAASAVRLAEGDTAQPEPIGSPNDDLAAKEAEASRLWPELERAAVVSKERRRLSPDLRDSLVTRLCGIAPLSARELATLMDRSEAYISDAIQPLVKSGRLTFLYPEQPRHPRQKYLSSQALPVKPAPQLPAKEPEPAILPPRSQVSAQEWWTELEHEAKPARENRYLGGPEFAGLLERLAAIAPVSPREVAILTDRREEYIRQVLEDMVSNGRLQVIVDESLGSKRTKYQALAPLTAKPEAAPPPRIAPPDPVPEQAAEATSEAGAETPSASRPPKPVRPTAPASPPPAAATRPVRPPGVPQQSTEPSRPKGLPPAQPNTGDSLPTQAGIPVSESEESSPVAARARAGILSPTTSLVSAIATGLIIGAINPPNWFAYALVLAIFLASLHLITDSAQYRRYRALNPRRDRKITFWVLKLLVSLTEIVVVYVATTAL